MLILRFVVLDLSATLFLIFYRRDVYYEIINNINNITIKYLIEANPKLLDGMGWDVSLRRQVDDIKHCHTLTHTVCTLCLWDSYKIYQYINHIERTILTFIKTKLLRTF